jgi:hypothetical protein
MRTLFLLLFAAFAHAQPYTAPTVLVLQEGFMEPYGSVHPLTTTTRSTTVDISAGSGVYYLDYCYTSEYLQQIRKVPAYLRLYLMNPPNAITPAGGTNVGTVYITQGGAPVNAMYAPPNVDRVFFSDFSYLSYPNFYQYNEAVFYTSYIKNTTIGNDPGIAYSATAPFVNATYDLRDNFNGLWLTIMFYPFNCSTSPPLPTTTTTTTTSKQILYFIHQPISSSRSSSSSSSAS